MKPEDIKDLLIALNGCVGSMTRKHVKQLYAVLIGCGQYPVCPVCNQPITTIKDFTWDHIRPASRGGSNDLSNMVPMHADCNVSKGNQFFEELFTINYQITAEIKLEVPKAKKQKKKKRKKKKISKFNAWKAERFGNCKKR